MEITHRQGNHRAHPYLLKIGRFSQLDFTLFMDERTMYNHNGNDQRDWNKLCGISFHLFTSHRNSVMIGWRYIPEANRFEFNAYYHVDGKVIYTPKLWTSEPGQKVTGLISVTDKRVIVQIGEHSHNQEFKKLRRWRRRIWPWFGGNKPAPKNVVFDLFVGVKRA